MNGVRSDWRVRLPMRGRIDYRCAVANIEGKATAITVLTPMTWWGPPLAKIVFWAARNVQSTLEKLRILSFIHYARWSMIERFPDGGGGERLNHTYLYFESNFNGTWHQYIDAFSEVLALRMKAIWVSSIGFPGPLPVERFKDYIRHNEYVASHYWSTYSGETTTEIVSAGRVQAAFAEFHRRSAGLEPDAFKAAYEKFLTEVQRDL